LTRIVRCDTILQMVAARVAGLALTLFACTAIAQERANATLTVAVVDPVGIAIRGARIVATEEVSGAQSEGMANASGQAKLQLSQGTYELRVLSKGFGMYVKKGVELKTETHRAVTLTIPEEPCTMACGPFPFGPLLELERPPLAAEIPFLPVPQLVLPAKTFHRKRF